MNDIPTHKARRLKLDDPRIVDRYLKELDKFFRTNSMYTRLMQLKKQCSEAQQMTTESQKEYEELDILREKGMHLTEKKCRKLRMGGVPWSPALKKAKDTILFWTLLKRRKKEMSCRHEVNSLLKKETRYY